MRSTNSSFAVDTPSIDLSAAVVVIVDLSAVTTTKVPSGSLLSIDLSAVDRSLLLPVDTPSIDVSAVRFFVDKINKLPYS
jgi:hypothetical protein